MIDLNMKCTKCKSLKPDIEFNFINKTKQIRRSACRNCTRLEWAQWAANKEGKTRYPENVREKIKREKFLSENLDLKFCFRNKHFVKKTDFDKCKSTPDGLQNTCKECRRQYRQENKEKINKNIKEHKQKHREKYLAQQTEYRIKNREEIRKSIRRHYQENKEYYKQNANNRKARILEAEGFYTVEQWQAKLKYYGHRCYLCGKSLEKEVPHIEHRKPISRGGTNWIANIAPACQFCNFSKHDMTENEYKEWRRNRKKQN